MKYETVEVFLNGVRGLKLEAFMSDDTILSLIASATEFDQIKARCILSFLFITRLSQMFKS